MRNRPGFWLVWFGMFGFTWWMAASQLQPPVDDYQGNLARDLLGIIGVVGQMLAIVEWAHAIQNLEDRNSNTQKIDGRGGSP